MSGHTKPGVGLSMAGFITGTGVECLQKYVRRLDADFVLNSYRGGRGYPRTYSAGDIAALWLLDQNPARRRKTGLSPLWVDCLTGARMLVDLSGFKEDPWFFHYGDYTATWHNLSVGHRLSSEPEVVAEMTEVGQRWRRVTQAQADRRAA